jgi:hypothetical protein
MNDSCKHGKWNLKFVNKIWNFKRRKNTSDYNEDSRFNEKRINEGERNFQWFFFSCFNHSLTEAQLIKTPRLSLWKVKKKTMSEKREEKWKKWKISHKTLFIFTLQTQLSSLWKTCILFLATSNSSNKNIHWKEWEMLEKV